MSTADKFRVAPGADVRLADVETKDTNGFADKDAGERTLAQHSEELAKLQHRLWAENKRSLLIVLQGMDTSGKDGVIRHVFSCLNPQGLHVVSFKKPSEIELDHDFLWRIHAATPTRGDITLFNRSHYEDVLVVRVHNLVPRSVWEPRYDLINAFERTLSNEGTTILKFFLHISHDEQRERLQSRLDDPDKNWKFNAQDVEERKHWDDYQRAYEDALSRCSTEHAPWFIIPSDRKWAQRAAISSILLETLEAMNPRYPRPSIDPASFHLDA